MKKLLMCSAAVALGLAVAAPAKADGIKLDLAGHFKGYVTWLSQDTEDTNPSTNERHFDILRETEIHFTGETTLDNGLTVGVHHEADLDSEFGGNDFFRTEESYAYFSGAWGRVNFGKEDGANYLLQVAAPSADENYDGLRQFINPENINLTVLTGGAGLAKGNNAFGTGQIGGLGGRGFVNTGKLDYSNDATGYSNKITYLTPVFSGFQAGASYTPSTGGVQTGGTPGAGSRAFGVTAKNTNNNNNAYGDAWEGAARYEGKWQEVGVTAGGGYTHVALQQSRQGALFGAGSLGTNVDDFNQWNLGAALTWQQLGLGVTYSKDNGGLSNDGDNRTWVAGIDWTTGPFKLGASYTNNHEDLGDTATGGAHNIATSNGTLDTTRWAGGVVYTYGPGMTFRGSVGFVKSDIPDQQSVALGTDSVKATDVLLGTQINF